MFNLIKNLFNGNRYKSHPEAVVIACFFNPQRSPYRIKAFNKFYDSIKHLNHHIIECVIGDDVPQLPHNSNIEVVRTPNLLWHKEALLNKVVRNLDKKYKYVFWLDADVIFTNKNWLVESVQQLQTDTIVQPFEYCIHLEQDEEKPNFKVEEYKLFLNVGSRGHKSMWRSFASNWVDKKTLANSEDYDTHGHVGFAWGARRFVLDSVPLFDKALIGGADHIIAHAAVNQIPHKCITKAFTEDIDTVLEWSKKFYNSTRGKLGYVKGDLYHIWHGDTNKRNYLKRVQEFTPKAKNIHKKDDNGLYVTDDRDSSDYMINYFLTREVLDLDPVHCSLFHNHHHHHNQDEHHDTDSNSVTVNENENFS